MRERHTQIKTIKGYGGFYNMRYNFLRYPGGKAKAVTLSYDDGVVEDIKFVEIIDKYGLKCTFNLVGNYVKNESRLSREFIRENILDKGHEIAVHGYFHRAQSKVRPIEGIRDIIDCRLELERTFGIIVRGMAFPDSVVNRFNEPEAYARVKSYLKDLEISYARTAAGDNDKFALPEDWLNWIPTVHHANPQVMEYAEKFVNLDVSKLYEVGHNPKLFYLWGHSYEFERSGNWDLLERICEKISNKSDIWYATNIEICDYVHAYDSLIYSADGTVVYNPTLFDIWFEVNKKPYVIKSGETITVED